MISRGIVLNLKANASLLTLIGSENLVFAEIGQGNKKIVVAGTKMPVDTNIPDLVKSHVQIRIEGFEIEEGELIGDLMVSIIKAHEGVILADPVKNYHIKSVTHVNGPTLVEWRDQKAFVANFEIVFREGLPTR